MVKKKEEVLSTEKREQIVVEKRNRAQRQSIESENQRRTVVSEGY